MQIFVRNTTPADELARFTAGRRSRAVQHVKARQDVRLLTNGARYRYYLVWITSLGHNDQVAIKEIGALHA